MISDELRNEIEYINDIISGAIYYGGDNVAYSHFDRLREPVEEWIAMKGLEDVCFIVEDRNRTRIEVKE